MKILIVYDVSYPHVIGGGQRRLYEVATRLAKSGHEIDWVCFKTWDKLNEAEHAGIKYIGISGFRGLYNKIGSRRKLEPIEFVFDAKYALGPVKIKLGLLKIYKLLLFLKDFNLIFFFFSKEKLDFL